jgi:aryl-alcohol dehydrogenase-like predicted oxidoreductase
MNPVEAHEFLKQLSPMKRLAEVGEVADLLLYLESAHFVNGEVVHLDGGAHAGMEEGMRGLDDIVRQGKVLYVGISDAPAWWIAQANTLADLRGWTQFTGLQIEYSLIERTVERELVPMAQALNLGILAWSPLAGGNKIVPCTVMRRTMKAVKSTVALAAVLSLGYSSVD